ncbi:MAG: SRPBCC domain-containing protein [Mucilaginibacter polytrichastri]|nr:SRPBCC domain-containing protein [Mucilaginibacter polytrichastri]
MEKSKTVGQTKSAGFEFGLRKTFDVSKHKLWEFLFTKEALKLWLGTIDADALEEKAEFKTKEGTTGEVRVLKPGSHIRFTWQPKGETGFSAVQVRVLEAKGKSTLAFHHDKLRDAAHREQMQKHWNDVMEKISRKIS